MHLSRLAIGLALLGLATCDPLIPQETPADGRPLLTTGITGSASGTGLQDPQYVLSLRPVQGLVLEATRHPLEPAEVDEALSGTAITAEILVDLGLLAEDGTRYRLAYSVLTTEDQERIFEVSRSFGDDLARRFMANAAELDRIVARYPRTDLRGQLKFCLVAGMVLNWHGLEQATRLGFLLDPADLPGGRSYFVHSEELGAEIPTEGFYSGSHTFNGPEMSFSTFGDGPSIPRRRGLPDVLGDPIEEGLGMLDDSPAVRGAVQRSLMPHLVEVLTDAGWIMRSVSEGTTSRTDLSQRSTMPPDRFTATLDLLVAIDYLAPADGEYTLRVPVLTEDDRPLIEAAVGLGTKIVSEWMKANHEPLEKRLVGLTPLRSGLPFEVVFNRVWHAVFGWTTRILAERGFSVDPRAAGSPREGYVPLVWESSLRR